MDEVPKAASPVLAQRVTDLNSVSATTKETTMKQSKFPPGWDEERVRRLLQNYLEQSEDEAVAEDEAAFEAVNETVMEIPTELVPAVRELIAKHRGKRNSS